MSDKKIKRYTVEEKTEIAMMYAGGVPVATIAEKFGRKANAILVMVNKMGVKRGDDVLNPSPNDDVKAKGTGKTRQSKLDKPWYLKK